MTRVRKARSAAALAAQASLALGILVGYYVFMLSIVAALLCAPFAGLTFYPEAQLLLTTVSLSLAALALLGIGLDLRRDRRFEAPGLRLAADSHPQLFALIQDVASATGERPPDEVYLLYGAQAWVWQRGGLVGWRSRRIMGLGLPLLQALSVNEFKAVLAHEFGHFKAGDVKLGPLIYRTREMLRHGAAQMEGTGFNVVLNFYGRVFMKLTHAIARQQEFVADAVAARAAGADVHAAALRGCVTADAAYSAYIEAEVMPVLHYGYLPPLAEGFDAFRREPGVVMRLTETLQEAAASAEADPSSFHPSLQERLAALGAPAAAESTGGSAAAALLNDLEQSAQFLLAHEFGADHVKTLRPLAWEEIGEAVLETSWRVAAATNLRWLRTVTADSIPAGHSELVASSTAFLQSNAADDDPDSQVDRAVNLLSVGLACLLLDRGWTLDRGLGRRAKLVNGSDELDPFMMVRHIVNGELTREAWKQRCESMGITGVPLGGRRSFV
jgi:heat shock protein HtpX